MPGVLPSVLIIIILILILNEVSSKEFLVADMSAGYILIVLSYMLIAILTDKAYRADVNDL